MFTHYILQLCQFHISMDDYFLYIWFKSERGDVIGQNQRGDSEVGHITKACSGLKSGENENSKC